MGYINASFLKEVNPTIKIVVMVLMTIVVTITYGLFIPIASLIFFFLAIVILGNINPLRLLKRLLPFFLFGIS